MADRKRRRVRLDRQGTALDCWCLVGGIGRWVIGLGKRVGRSREGSTAAAAAAAALPGLRSIQMLGRAESRLGLVDHSRRIAGSIDLRTEALEDTAAAEDSLVEADTVLVEDIVAVAGIAAPAQHTVGCIGAVEGIGRTAGLRMGSLDRT